MALANVALTDTFDVWRTRTNQIIIALSQDETILNAAFTAANTGAVTAYNQANAAFAKANSANYFSYLVNANTTAAFLAANTALAGGGANAAFDRANVAIANVNYVNSYAQSVNTIAVAAFDKANNAGGGFYRGNNGEVGSVSGKNDIFRVNVNYINGNIYFNAGENASATGPLSVNVGFILQINTDARVVII